MTIVNFVVHKILPLVQYLFFAGLIGAIPVIIITAVKTAESMLEPDAEIPDHRMEEDLRV